MKKTFETIAHEILKISFEQMQDTLTPKDAPDWDSINYLLFISELEKEFNISFTMDEVLQATSLGDVRKAFAAKFHEKKN